ncbi:hypothetical protein [Thermorudis peleae]|uniref:hypothetical protein n=1 Tax=Thermorudis peleae TaxID=1382356 RepID=UPI00056EC184|nr:hypothetical protein [Thermorudis peleae]
MSPELGRAAFTLVLFFLILSLFAVALAPRGTPAFPISLVSLFISLCFLGLVIALVRRQRHE